VYTHRDHYAEHQALYSHDLIPTSGNHPQYGATCHLDRDHTGASRLPGGRSGLITSTIYSANMTCPPGYMNKEIRLACLSWVGRMLGRGQAD
jgi:hypothetical protein